MPETNDSKRFHLSLNVRDLDRAVAFYQNVLGVAPAKHFADYAKFELSDPPLVLALEPGRGEGQERLNHFGVRLEGSQALQEIGMRAHQTGLSPQLLQGVECCYSRQTKICLNDPDGNLVEFYLLDEELDHQTKGAATTATPAPAEAGPVVWDHLLGSPFPDTIPLPDAAAEEVRLRGTFNVRRSQEETKAIFAEVTRVLRPGGKLLVHLLTADQEVEKKLPRLPGPAALVEYAPVDDQLVKTIEAAGFGAVEIQRLSHSAVFQFGGAQMRELMLTASRRPLGTDGASPEYTVVYKGPFPEITDENGTRFRRGERTKVAVGTYDWLRQGVYADHFVVLNESSPQACAAPVAETISEATV